MFGKEGGGFWRQRFSKILPPLPKKLPPPPPPPCENLFNLISSVMRNFFLINAPFSHFIKFRRVYNAFYGKNRKNKKGFQGGGYNFRRQEKYPRPPMSRSRTVKLSKSKKWDQKFCRKCMEKNLCPWIPK